MIYLDNAATTAIKPPSVVDAFTNSIKNFSFNPGRGGYKQSIETANEIYSCRKAVKDLVNCDDESNV